MTFRKPKKKKKKERKTKTEAWMKTRFIQERVPVRGKFSTLKSRKTMVTDNSNYLKIRLLRYNLHIAKYSLLKCFEITTIVKLQKIPSPKKVPYAPL